MGGAPGRSWFVATGGVSLPCSALISRDLTLVPLLLSLAGVSMMAAQAISETEVYFAGGQRRACNSSRLMLSLCRDLTPLRLPLPCCAPLRSAVSGRHQRNAVSLHRLRKDFRNHGATGILPHFSSAPTTQAERRENGGALTSPERGSDRLSPCFVCVFQLTLPMPTTASLPP